MKLIELIKEGAISVKSEMAYVRVAFSDLAKDLVDSDFDYDKTIKVLNTNGVLGALGVVFQDSSNWSSNFSSSSSSANVALDGAEYNPGNDTIAVFVLHGLDDVLNDKYKFDEFVQIVTASIGHELIHRHQLYRARGQGLHNYSTEKLETYLADHREMMAYAFQAVHEIAGATGATSDQIKAQLNGAIISSSHEFTTFSDAFRMYMETFEDDVKNRNKFLKYMYSYLDKS